MRAPFAIWWILLPLALLPGRAEETPEAIIARAMKAIDGQGKMAAAKTVTRHTNGQAVNGLVSLTMVTMQDPAHFSMDYVVMNPAVKGSDSVVYSDSDTISEAQGWSQANFESSYSDIAPAKIDDYKRQAYLAMAPANPALLRDKVFQLKVAPRETFEGHPVDVLEVTGPGGLPFRLSFAVDTGLPSRIEWSYMEKGQSVTSITTFSDYQEFSGVLLATNLHQKSANATEDFPGKLNYFRLDDKVFPNQFGKPAAGKVPAAGPGPANDVKRPRRPQ